MRLKPTNRGFLRADFVDIYGGECSIQESSLAGNRAIWLGMNTGTHDMGECMARMHIDRRLAKKLIPLLQHFVETGRLPEPKKRAARRAKGGG